MGVGICICGIISVPGRASRLEELGREEGLQILVVWSMLSTDVMLGRNLPPASVSGESEVVWGDSQQTRP